MLKYILRAKTVTLSVVAVQECNQVDDFFALYRTAENIQSMVHKAICLCQNSLKMAKCHFETFNPNKYLKHLNQS